MKLSRITALLMIVFASFALALPALAQDATAEATSSADLQTFTTEKGDASVQFPAGWLSENVGNSTSILSVKLANNQSALGKELFNKDDVFQPGEVHIEVAVISLSELVKEMPAGSITLDSTPLELVQALAKQGMPDEFTFGNPGTVTINDRPAVRMNLTAEKRGEGQLLLTIVDKQWVEAIILYAAPGEGDKWDLTARDILASIKISPKAEATPEPTIESTRQPTVESTAEPVALTQTAKLNNGLGVVSYPDKWFTRQYQTQTIYISNSQAALEKSFGSAMSAGQVNILVTMSSADDYIKQAQLPAKADATPLELLQLTIKAVGENGITFATPEATTVGDKQAARVDFTSKAFEGTAWLIEYQKGAIIAVQMLTAPGETQRWQPTALAIAASIRSTD